LLVGETVVVLEAKSGNALLPARRQVEGYALLLHYFHKPSAEKRIVPIIVSPEATPPRLDAVDQFEMFPQLAAFWICTVIQSPWTHIAEILTKIAHETSDQLDPSAWDASPYHPVPSIIDAAMALR